MGKIISGLKSAEGYLFTILACAIYSLGTVLFLEPTSIVAGGMTGLAIVINIVNSHIPLGVTIIILNIPILAFAIRSYGWRFAVKCLMTFSLIGVFTELFAFLKPLTDDPILAALYGGVFQGVSIGLFIKHEFSSGGTELLARLVNIKVPHLKIPVIVGILDGIIVALGALVTKNPSNMLYALIVIFVSTRISEIIITGLEKSKLCIIITDKGDEISHAIIEKIPRGVTMLQGKGMYTELEHKVLLTCVKTRQLPRLKNVIVSIDPAAFIIINDSKEVQGQGFGKLGS